ncbi:MAG: tetratricopeptide repeat protein [Flavobacterium sp.]
MNVTEFTYLLNHPNAVNEKQSKALEAVIDSFPYFQSARALYLKGLYNQDSYKYNFVLKQTAAHTTDRSVLFDFITSDEFTIIDRNVYERKLEELMQMDVHSCEVLSEEEPWTEGETETEIEVKVEETESQTITEENTEETAEEFLQEEAIIDALTEEKELEQPLFRLTENEPILDLGQDKDFVDNLTEQVIEVVPSDDEPTEISAEASQASVQEITQTEENLQLGKPLAFKKDERHSFQEWLQLTSIQPIQRVQEPKEVSVPKETTPKPEENKLKKLELIDKFIESNPKISPVKEAVEPTVSVEIPDTSHLMTETLARVYLEQKKYQKAIQAYEILILKYPEKSVFFADRIRDIKKLQQNNL